MVRRSGLNCVVESLCGFWKVGRVHECLPTNLLELLKPHAAVVQHALTDMGRLAVGPVRAEEAWYRIGDLTELVFALPQCFLSALALRQIEHECDALATALFKCCPTNQHGHTATVFSGVFLFERLEPAAIFLLFDPCVFPFAPVGRRQVPPPFPPPNQAFASLLHHPNKFVARPTNPTSP